MDLIPIKRLFLVAGFGGQDLDARVSALQRRFEGGDRKFIWRVYPMNAEKRENYLRNLVYAANKVIFGKDGAVNFCRKQDQLCAISQGKGDVNGKKCERKYLPLIACGRARPQLIVILCADRIYDEAFQRIGRAALLIRFEGDQFPDDDTVLAKIEEMEPIARQVINSITNRPKSHYAPLIPFVNFQKLAVEPIACDVQRRPEAFAEIMQGYHYKLYDGSFKNPKKNVRGAYMLDADTAFQQDHLHKTVQVIGKESHEDGFHLLNAYHLYGVGIDPGFHFDVMNINGNAINHVFEDVLTGEESNANDQHVNITPCDRRL
jgi:hypothetical protein